jgi:hypothetical protein
MRREGFAGIALQSFCRSIEHQDIVRNDDKVVFFTKLEREENYAGSNK